MSGDDTWTVDYTILDDEDIATDGRSNALCTLDDDLLNLARKAHEKEANNTTEEDATACQDCAYGHPDAAALVASLRPLLSSTVSLDPQELSNEPQPGDVACATEVSSATAYTWRSKTMWSTPPLPLELVATKRAAVAAMMKMTEVIFANSMAARTQLRKDESNVCTSSCLATEPRSSPYRHREELAQELLSPICLQASSIFEQSIEVGEPSCSKDSLATKVFLQRAARGLRQNPQQAAVTVEALGPNTAVQARHPLLGEGNWSPRATAVAAVNPNVARKLPQQHKIFDDNVGAASLAAVELLNQTTARGIDNLVAARTTIDISNSGGELVPWRRCRYHEGGSEPQRSLPSPSVERQSAREENRPRPLPGDIAKLTSVTEWETCSPESLREDSPRQRMRSVTFL